MVDSFVLRNPPERKARNRFLRTPKQVLLLGTVAKKIRLAIASKGKGKRGGARVVIQMYIATETVYLLTIYDKSKKSDLKPNEHKEMIEILELE
jgi:mRNA-degrading endonuclease RelE of RelBE toxin-antitoxin system